MNRAEVAQRIRWSWIIWTAGIVNVGAMLPQLMRVILTQRTEGISLEMFWIYFGIQIAFSIEGYFTRNRMLMVCMALSAFVNAITIACVLYFRHLAS